MKNSGICDDQLEMKFWPETTAGHSYSYHHMTFSYMCPCGLHIVTDEQIRYINFEDECPHCHTKWSAYEQMALDTDND